MIKILIKSKRQHTVLACQSKGKEGGQESMLILLQQQHIQDNVSMQQEKFFLGQKVELEDPLILIAAFKNQLNYYFQ